MENSSLLLLTNTLKKTGIELNHAQLNAFNSFGNLLIERNRYVNLTAIKDERDIIIKHFIDSLSLAIYVPELTGLLDNILDCAGIKMAPNTVVVNTAAVQGGDVNLGATLIDIGTGAGFPGLPLKILFGDKLAVTMIDSVRKKVNFVNEAARMLCLSGCEALHMRAEDAARSGDFRGRFVFAAARALAPLPKVVDYCVPFLRSGGILIAMKGRRESAEEEFVQAKNQLSKTGGKLLRMTTFKLDAPDIPDLPGISDENTQFDRTQYERMQYERTLVIIKRL